MGVWINKSRCNKFPITINYLIRITQVFSNIYYLIFFNCYLNIFVGKHFIDFRIIGNQLANIGKF